MSVHTARAARPRPAARRSLLALPVVALLAAAGCGTGDDGQAAAERTVTATVSAPVETTPVERRQERTGGPSDDRTNCDAERSGEDFSGSVHVRAGQTCVLTDLTVNGDIDVDDGGRLEARDVRVTEDIEAEGHSSVLISGGEVSGSIELDRGGEATVENVRIGGDLESDENSGPQRFLDNTIGGDLECDDNAQAPTGGGNQVGGEREGQCANL